MAKPMKQSDQTSRVRDVPTPVGNGYPVEVSTKTKTYRGAGVITKGKKISDRMG